MNYRLRDVPRPMDGAEANDSMHLAACVAVSSAAGKIYRPSPASGTALPPPGKWVGQLMACLPLEVVEPCGVPLRPDRSRHFGGMPHFDVTASNRGT